MDTEDRLPAHPGDRYQGSGSDSQRSVRRAPGGGQISIVGYGLFPFHDVTAQALSVLATSAEVILVAATPTIHSFLTAKGIQYCDIGRLYVQGKPRRRIYLDIAAYVLERVSEVHSICYLTYGHPLWLDDIVRLIVSGAALRNVEVEIVSGISFVDSILTARRIHVGDGLQVYEATVLVHRELRLEPRVPALIAQVGAFDQEDAKGKVTRKAEELWPLVDYLIRYYPPDHTTTICDSREGGMCACFCDIPLCTLHLLADSLTYASTLLLPALPQA